MNRTLIRFYPIKSTNFGDREWTRTFNVFGIKIRVEYLLTHPTVLNTRRMESKVIVGTNLPVTNDKVKAINNKS